MQINFKDRSNYTPTKRFMLRLNESMPSSIVMYVPVDSMYDDRVRCSICEAVVEDLKPFIDGITAEMRDSSPIYMNDIEFKVIDFIAYQKTDVAFISDFILRVEDSIRNAMLDHGYIEQAPDILKSSGMKTKANSVKCRSLADRLTSVKNKFTRTTSVV